jgi:hypothetical protein
MSTIRTAKKANNTNTTARILPGSMVLTAKPQKTRSKPSAIHIRPGDRGSKFIANSMVHRGGFEPP